ncbi:hypothetical protein G6M70_06170 [Agrobacterium tumefaciens]|uniref:hypothetical protein n=1 Tax=Agrobacterium tumefaciens TaxID=358 RepID=UPI00157177A3|nr:hypothetical protein [Agrobacterium tumefaciens]NSZ00654.1 hypothetical protein [Agrobacterium tumefaciens]NSZ38148.1 hypothetical protein [Agrobacterium tumefaciens]NTB25605.1 hypothetical protein [Agrobacterium tumefaciens]NTB27052.1 hypothetical protein [Agrobacterium tumefaciens]NTB32322.1 hypothetical protein [Agrobacterium tumefaciens]
MSDNTSKETRLSLALFEKIEAYASDNDMRYNAQAIRQLLEIGLKSSEPLEDVIGPHEKRVPLSVSKHLHGAVLQVRKKLSVPANERTYELAYRLVIVRGLRTAGVELETLRG